MEVSVSTNPLNPRGFAITFPYRSDSVDLIKRCLDTAWNKELKAWLSQGPEILLDMQRFGITIGWISIEARARAEAFRKELWDAGVARMMDIGTEQWAYQKQGSAWLNALSSAVLGDEMGVGKTKQSLDSAVEEPEVLTMTNSALITGSRTVLILTNKTLTYNWLNEIEKWHPTWQAGVVPQDKRTRRNRAGETIQGRDDFWLERPDIVIAHYDQILRDDWPFELDWDVLICDEATRFKNKTTQIFKRIETLSRVVLNEETWYSGLRHFWCLTGTPMEKRVVEFWNLMNLIRPGLLGNWMRFKEQHLETDDDGEVVGVRDLELLRERVGYFLLRRTRKEVQPWLPDKLYNNAIVEFSPAELAAYTTFKSDFNNWLTDRGVSGSNNPMTQTLRMRQFCCSPMIFTDELGFGSKYEALYDVLEDWPGMVVIFSYFKEMTRLLQDWYDTNPRAYIDGDVPAQERFRRCEDFCAGRLGKVFISTDAGNSGLNIPAADLVIHYDQGQFNAMKLRQREDRLLREGQTADKVNVLNMMMLDSIDIGMYQLAREEDQLFGDVVDGAEQMMMRRMNTPRWQQLVEGRLGGVTGRNLQT